MSLASWKKKYYPAPAESATGSDLEAVQHSLRKWRGAEPAVLSKHGLAHSWEYIYDKDDPGEDFIFAGNTCALCRRVPDCNECIGTRANGCECSGSLESPYYRFRGDGNLEPMIAWLRKALALAKKEARG